MDKYVFDWSELAFSSKKLVRELGATFIAAPRYVSKRRFIQLVKTYLPHGNLVLGLAKESHVLGLEDCPQFTMLSLDDIESTILQVNAKSRHKIYVLRYGQAEATYLYGALSFKKVVLVNGSWLYSFHTKKDYYALVAAGTPFEFVTPFVDEAEARHYAGNLAEVLRYTPPTHALSGDVMIAEAKTVARSSYDTSFQVGAILASKKGARYQAELAAHNVVVPYETFAFHHGASRERHLSPIGDQNHYDTIHAETALIIEAGRRNIPLAEKTLFISLSPCPTCARNLSYTDIAEIIYSEDRGGSYAIAMLEQSGKKVRRLTSIGDVI